MSVAPCLASPPVVPTYAYLHDLMAQYQIKDLVKVSPEAFTRTIGGFLQGRDSAGKPFEHSHGPGSLSGGFQWGHHHDFGEFGVPGRMGKHHMSMLKVFMDDLGVLPRSLDGLRVLDIGCWTGGTSLLLRAMGATVVAVEEVKPYAECLAYLCHAFDLDDIDVRTISLYDCREQEFQDAFDIVLLTGVLHHVSDPKLALRILFNCLKDTGRCLIETVAITPETLIAECERLAAGGSVEGRDDLIWNRLLFLPENLTAMMASVGYDVIHPGQAIRFKTPHERFFVVGQRNAHVDLRRNGLSVRDIR